MQPLFGQWRAATGERRYKARLQSPIRSETLRRSTYALTLAVNQRKQKINAEVAGTADKSYSKAKNPLRPPPRKFANPQSRPRPPRLSQNRASWRDAWKVAGGEPRSGAAPGHGRHGTRASEGATEVLQFQMLSIAPPGLLIKFQSTPGCASLARGYCLQPFQG